MADFNLGKAKCELRDYADIVMGEYYRYFKKNGIDPFKDSDEQAVKNFFELNSMSEKPIVFCKDKNDYQKLMDRINELRSAIKL